MRTVRRIGHLTLAKTMKLLLDGPATAHEVAEVTGIHLRTAQEWMRALKTEGVTHISAWHPDSLGRDSIPVYKIGAGKDKPRSVMGTVESSRRYRARLKLKARDKMILGV
jgi:DNA-directed RNA polymerase specialized sigma subunit